MKTKLALLAAAGSFAMISGAVAQDDSGYYGALGAGIVLDSDTNDFESGVAGPAAFDTELDLDSAITVYGAVGKYLDHGLRGELELATRSQELSALPGDGLGFAGFPSNSSLGDVSATTLMANVYKDFDIDEAGRLSPYLGAGVGVARIRSEFNNLAVGTAAATVADMATSNTLVVGDKNYTPAIQGMAGLVFDFTENMMIDLRYRYLATGEYDYGGYVNGVDAVAAVSGEYSAQEITAGFRWNFGVAPAAAPAPAPVQYKTCFDGSRVPVATDCPPEVEVDEMVEMDPLTVYFDYDKSNLTDAAQTLIAARAAEALEGDVQSVTVAGNTDSAGSAAYNNALSARRASVVKDALVANGIDASAISVEALGESNPAKATADGAREPLNRRTDVVFGF